MIHITTFLKFFKELDYHKFLITPPGGLLISSTLEGDLLERGRLTNFLKYSIAKYLLFENRERYSYCLVYGSLVHNRTKKLKNCVVIVDKERFYLLQVNE